MYRYSGHFKFPNNKLSFEEPQRQTESQGQFPWKVSQPCTTRNPEMEKLAFMKPFEESHFHNAPKPLTPFSSIYKQDYPWKSKVFEEDLPASFVSTSIEPNKTIMINRGMQGYGLLLHHSATTNNLTYKGYSSSELDISGKDNITFWNWDEKKIDIFRKGGKLFVKNERCYKKTQSLVKTVPNTGFTTESSSNYIHNLNFASFNSRMN